MWEGEGGLGVCSGERDERRKERESERKEEVAVPGPLYCCSSTERQAYLVNREPAEVREARRNEFRNVLRFICIQPRPC